MIPALDTDSIYKIPGALHAEGLDAIVCKKLGIEPPPADLSTWNELVDALEHPEHAVQHRDGRQVRRPDRVVQVAVGGADPRRHPHALAGADPLRRLRGGRARRHRLPEGHGRDPRARRLRQARRRGQDRGDPLRARERHSVSRHLPRHAARGDRVRAARGGPRRREQHRVRSDDAASGGRADHRMAEPRRLDRAAQRELRPGRHDAPRRAAVRCRARLARAPHLRLRRRCRSGTAIATK